MSEEPDDISAERSASPESLETRQTGSTSFLKSTAMIGLYGALGGALATLLAGSITKSNEEWKFYAEQRVAQYTEITKQTMVFIDECDSLDYDAAGNPTEPAPKEVLDNGIQAMQTIYSAMLISDQDTNEQLELLADSLSVLRATVRDGKSLREAQDYRYATEQARKKFIKAAQDDFRRPGLLDGVFGE